MYALFCLSYLSSHCCIDTRMNRYVEMGFSEEFASEALSRFGDDLHAGCHWLMMRDTMGRVPKRLKDSKRSSGDSYKGSKVRYLGLSWTVTGFDKKHALVRLDNNKGMVRWEHMSDGRIVWIQVRHDDVSSTVPSVTWKRNVGSLGVSLAWLDKDRLSCATSENILDMYIKHGRPQEQGQEWTKWRFMCTIMRVYVHEPTRPRPKGVFADDVRNFRAEWMSYFNALCDLYEVSQDDFNEKLYNESFPAVLSLFPEDTRSDLELKIVCWRDAKQCLIKLNKQWHRDCVPLIEFACSGFDSGHMVVDVFVHNLTFVRPLNYNAGIHMQLQRLFFSVFPATLPELTCQDMPMDANFLRMILKQSKKDWKSKSNPGPDFVSELFPYQKRCLNWMLHREMTPSESTSLWGWTRHQLDDGFTFHTSVFGHISLAAPASIARGGLLAQDVGMGKTVEMLALIASNKVVGPTLIVVPTTMLGPWQAEAVKHTPSMKVVKFHGARRTKNMDDLRDADIVLTTYRIVVNETQQHVPTIGSIRWGRIILDESHDMKHVHTETTKAICRLFSPLRWCISATPWPKAMVHATSILAFLGCQPFDQAPKEDTFSAAHLILRNSRAFNSSLVGGLLKSLTWFQCKRHVSLCLPGVSEEICEIECDYPELYSQLITVVRFRLDLDALLGRHTRARVLHYTRWLRQMTIHVSLNRITNFAMPTATDEAESEYSTIDNFVQTLGGTNYEQSLKDVVDSWRQGNETCVICRDAIDRPTLTPCNHLYCFECIQTCYQHDPQRKCPMCRQPAGVVPLRELTEEEVHEEKDTKLWRSHDAHGYPVSMDTEIHTEIQRACAENGSKLDMLLQLAKQPEKCVVFTQFHSAWLKICSVLKQNSIEFASIEGRMTPNARMKAIEKFQTDEKTQVFVMTTKTASVGITLTAGSRVIFMEPCEDKHLRKQAIGRVWRIGQTRPIKVTTFKMKNTIDMLHSKDIMGHVAPDLV